MRQRTISVNRILIVILAAVVILLAGIFSTYRVQADTALRRAKDVSLSMRLLAVYSRSGQFEIYNQDSNTGLTPQAELELVTLAGIEPGSVQLKGWDASQGTPECFTYAYRQCIVTYRLKENQKADWTVEYRLPILRYG